MDLKNIIGMEDAEKVLSALSAGHCNKLQRAIQVKHMSMLVVFVLQVVVNRYHINDACIARIVA